MNGIDISGVSWVQLSYVDVFGTSHSMQLPAARFQDAVSRGELFDGSSLEGRTRLIETDMRLRPDPASLIRIEPGLGRAVCAVLSKDGSPWPADPRTALALVVEECGSLGTSYTVAAELEFYLLDSSQAPVDRGGYFDEIQGIGAKVVREAADRLASYGVAVDSSHHATFMPRPLADEAGSGLHLHQRLGPGLMGEDGLMSEEGRCFLAGQLAHGRGLVALAAPTVNSYKRLHSGPEAPAASVWAHLNRGALIRLSHNVLGGATLEFRASDPSANPYLLFAGFLAAGADGIITDLELPPAFEEEIGSFDPAAIDSTRSEPLPRDLDEALDALMSDDVLVDTFDQQLLSRLVDGRRAEAAAYRAQVTPWEIDRYLDEA